VSGAESALEGAILAVLAADADVAPVLGDPLRVVEAGSPAPAYPYLEMARHVSEPCGGVNAEASEHRVDIVVVSRDLGGAEAKSALAAVRGALTGAALEMEGWRCVLLVPLFADATRQRIGLWRALLRIKVVVEVEPG
jgi:hypothetical protein